MDQRVWNWMVVGSGTVLVGSLLARGHYTVRVRLTPDRSVSAPTALTVVAVVVLVSALVGRRRETAGLLGLAIACLGVATIWVLLGNHRFEGPVLMHFSRTHGLHLTDPLASVPLALAGLLVVRGVRRVLVSGRFGATSRSRA